MTLKIESAQNETFRRYLSLTGSKGLKKEGLFLLSGEKLVREFLLTPSLDLVGEIVAPQNTALASTNPVQFTSDLFSQIDVLGTRQNILVLKQPILEKVQIADYTPDGIEVVIPVGDPGNLGALLRSCEAFGIRTVILTEESAHPFLPKAVKASAGSALRLNLRSGPQLSKFPETCLALDLEGTPLKTFKWPKSGLLVVGEEGEGLGTGVLQGGSRFSQRIYIPTQGVESLNAVVAASIALAHRAMEM